jgi:hypothetical protein
MGLCKQQSIVKAFYNKDVVAFGLMQRLIVLTRVKLPKLS